MFDGAEVIGHAGHVQALERVMSIAEFNPNGMLDNANENFLALLGYTREDAIGRHHRDFCTSAFANSDEYTEFWPALQDGRPRVGLAERLRRDGRSCWFEATYTPVLGAQGQVQSILKIATDVTERVIKERAQRAHLQRLSLVADASDTAILISDENNKIVYINRGFSRLFGWQLDEIAGKTPIAVLAPHLPQDFTEVYGGSLRRGDPVEREEIVASKSGGRFWVKAISNPICHPTSGNIEFAVTTLTDITSSKMHEVLQHRILEAMARETSLTEVLELVCKEVENIAPEIAVSILGVSEKGLLYPLVAPNLPTDYSRHWQDLPIGPAVGSCGTSAWRNEKVCVDDIATSPLWENDKRHALPLGFVACWSTPIRDNRGNVVGTFAFYFKNPRQQAAEPFHQLIIDGCVHLCALAMEREQSRQRIRQLAFYDGLTGLPNRSLLQVKADQAIAAATRSKGQLAVVFFDLDRFKHVNDSLGHPAGDELLCQIATQLKHELRASDIAGRLSGDEFVALLPECGAERAAEVVERILKRLGDRRVVAGASLNLSASAGIAMFPRDGSDMETLLHRADMAMYQAKGQGHGCLSFYSAEMNKLMQERLVLEAALRQAIQKKQLRLHYQPQIDLETGKIYGVEALARWAHPEFGVVSPARFIPLAEECGLIADLGRWALREACQQLARWRTQGLEVPTVSVNLSPTSFHNLDLPRMIADTLSRHDLDPCDLMLEITESVLLDTNPSTAKTIAEVHEQGIRLSMDDFGTGYSSLSYLRRLPISELKLDRSFVADLDGDETSRALSAAILSIGKSLHLAVVAEGVETTSQKVILSQQGYAAAQGFLFGKPMEAQDFERWFKNVHGQ